MLTLAIETSTPRASVALGDESGLLAESILSMRVSHSESVMPDIVRLLTERGFAHDDISSVAVGAGPGSFTGVRVAAAIAKGICYARSLPLFAYNGLRVAAAGLDVERDVCVLFDARREEVYAAAFRRVDPPQTLMEPSVRRVGQVLDALAPVAHWTFAGDGALKFEARIRDQGGSVLPADAGVPRASTLLRLRREYPEEGRIRDVATWEPSYIRASGAERALGA